VARKRIGLQTARLEYGYGVKLWQGAMARAEEADADLIVFPGRNLEAPTATNTNTTGSST
jgi:hypothetical protein